MVTRFATKQSRIENILQFIVLFLQVGFVEKCVFIVAMNLNYKHDCLDSS
jgi:hypothetical protein